MANLGPTPDDVPARPRAPRPARRSAPPPRRPGARRGPTQVQSVGSPRLGDTAGPDPATPIADVRLVVGVLDGAHGVGGELKLRLTSDDPGHLATLDRVWIGDEERARRLLGLRLHAGRALIRLGGVSTREAAAALRGRPVRIAGSDARRNAPGEFFLFQLVGLDVFDETGANLGRVTDVLETGAHDVFVVTPPGDGADLLLPNHPEFVLDIRPEQGRMVVRPPIYA